MIKINRENQDKGKKLDLFSSLLLCYFWLKSRKWDFSPTKESSKKGEAKATLPLFFCLNSLWRCYGTPKGENSY